MGNLLTVENNRRVFRREKEKNKRRFIMRIDSYNYGMGAEMCHTVLSAIWRTRKAGDMIQAESKGLRP